MMEYQRVLTGFWFRFSVIAELNGKEYTQASVFDSLWWVMIDRDSNLKGFGSVGHVVNNF